MTRFAARLLSATAALPIAALIALAPTAAHADWRGGGYGYHGGYGGGGYGYRGGYGGGGYGGRGYGGYGYNRGPDIGPVIGGALLGLGVGAVLAAPYLAPPPPVIYAPPPSYYPPPGYAYYPPQAYYGQ